MKYIPLSMLLSCSLGIGVLQAVPPTKQITAGADSTVYGIAHEHGIRTQALIQANNLKPPYTLKKGQVLRIPAPNEHVVRNGESLHNIAEDYGVKIDVLAHENDIQAPYFVKDGDTLLIPPPDTVSMAEALKPPVQEINTSSLEPLPLVKSEPAPGKLKTLGPPVKTPAVLPNELAEELTREKEKNSNSAGVGAAVVGAGATIVGAGVSTVASAPKPEIMGNLAAGKSASAPVPVPLDSTSKEEEIKPVKKETKTEEKIEEKIVKKEDKEKNKKEEKAQEALFTWPVEGKIISKFRSGGKNDGINIEVPEGTPVKAAGHGEVMYAGSELKGFGNLLLIKHNDGWMTAYAHNAELLVKKGDTVEQGQVIAKSGNTGDVKTPQLHFEVRKGKQPVDPLPKLRS